MGKQGSLLPGQPDPEFYAFWQLYPRRVAKLAAMKAFAKARRIANFEDIMAGVARYAASRSGQDPQFTAHGSSWLNAGRWMDEPEPPRAPQLRGTAAIRDRLRQEIENGQVQGYGSSGESDHGDARRLVDHRRITH